MANIVFPIEQAQLGVGIESSRGSAASVGSWLPFLSPDYTPNVAMLEDKGFRGSMDEVFDLIPGLHYDELSFGGYPYLDTFPVLLTALLGSPDTVGTAPANTTLSASAAAGASVVNVVASVAAGSYVAIGSGSSLETHKIASVSGTALTLAYPLVYTQPSGASVVGQTTHQTSLLNNAASVGNQPPSLTIDYFSGSDWRQITGAQMDTLSLKWSATTMIEYQTKFLGNPATILGSAPSSSYTTERAPASWTSTVAIGGSQVGTLLDGELTFNRSASVVAGMTGTQAPFVAGLARALACTAKLTLIEQSGSPFLTALAAGTTESLDVTWFDIYSGHALNLNFAEFKYKTGKIPNSSDFVKVEVNCNMLPTTTNATAGGVSPVLATTANSTTTAYH